MSLKDTLADEKRLGRFAHQYVIGWTQGELRYKGRPSDQLHSIRLVVEAYSELEKEQDAPTRN